MAKISCLKVDNIKFKKYGKKEVIIEATENGPYLVKVNGNIIAALCRCGQSKDNPIVMVLTERQDFKAKERNKILKRVKIRTEIKSKRPNFGRFLNPDIQMSP